MSYKNVWPIPRIDYMPFTSIEEKRSVALIYAEPAWKQVKDQFQLPVESRIKINEPTEEHWVRQSKKVRGEVIYAVGGGLVADAAKYFAARLNLPLICVPTVLSGDAFLTWTSGVRRNGTRVYIETRPPDRLIVDLQFIAASASTDAVTGICDVLSIATASWDWRYAELKQRNPPQMAYLAYVDQAAKAVMQGAVDCAEAAGQGDVDGLQHLWNCLALEVQLCNQIGHSRPVEGSEHYFAYAVENSVGRNLLPGDLIGTGIVLMAAMQDQDLAPLKRALKACHISLTSVPITAIRNTLYELPSYSRYHALPYGIAYELDETSLNRLPPLD